MDEARVLKVLNDIGVNNVNEEDYKVYEEYFVSRGELSSDDSDSDSSDDNGHKQVNDTLNLSDISLLKDIPNVSEIVDDYNNINVLQDVIIQIETSSESTEVIDNDDSGREVVVVDNCADVLPPVLNAVPDENEVIDFLAEGCGCKSVCCRQFQEDELLKMRRDCIGIDFYENNVNKLDQIILAQLNCLTKNADTTACSRQLQSVRKQPRAQYLIRGIPVCRTTFMFAHNVKIKRFKRLTSQFNKTGFIAKEHGNTGKLAKNVTSFSRSEFVVRFLQNFAEQNAILLPGRASTIYNASLKLLPSNETKLSVYNKYLASFTEEVTEKPVSSKVFSNIWRETCRDVVIMRPRSDLCNTCQKHYTSGSQMAQATEEEKMETLMKMRSHLELVAKERAFYKQTIKESRETFAKFENREASGSNQPIIMHYSFDMAQQVHIPSNPLQPGPIYFLVPFKIGIFGVMCDTLNKQVNYLIPESVEVGKGSNLIVSLFHHYLENVSIGAEIVYIHADNCVAQNKNNILMGYLAWRISQKLNKKIVLSFLPVGHTKFSCDWGFGLLKKKFKTTFVSSIQELVNTVEQSTPTSKVNSAIATGDEIGNSNVDVYDWLEFFKSSNCKKIKHITSYNHFEFENTKFGTVKCKTDLDGNEFIHKMFPSEHDGLVGFPEKIVPTGMSEERKKYLHKHIRPHCKDLYKDLLCPEVPTNMDEVADEPAPVQGTSRGNKRKRSI